MKPRPLRLFLPGLALALLAACGSAPPKPDAPAAAAAEVSLQPPAALHTEGLPPVPQRLLAPIQRWTAVSGHDFVDWHPVRREMLVSHRPPGASTTQIFRVRAPLAEPEPLNGAGHIRKPLFVVQGRNDPRVPWTESEQIVRRLQAQGTPVWYLLASNEGHGFSRRENADFYFAALATFVEMTLLR